MSPLQAQVRAAPDLRCEKIHNADATGFPRGQLRDSGSFCRDDGATDVSRARGFGWLRPVVALSGSEISENPVTSKLN